MTKEIVKRMEVDIDRGWALNFISIFVTRDIFLSSASAYMLLVVDFHELPSEIGEEKHVNIPLRNSLLSNITF